MSDDDVSNTAGPAPANELVHTPLRIWSGSAVFGVVVVPTRCEVTFVAVTSRMSRPAITARASGYGALIANIASGALSYVSAPSRRSPVVYVCSSEKSLNTATDQPASATSVASPPAATGSKP